jgi:hypothetical protein
MKLQLHTLAYLTLLSNPALAQLLSANTAQLIAWKSYGEIIRQLFTAGQSLEAGVDYLFATPPSAVAIRGGSPCPEAVTTFDLCEIAQTRCKSRAIPSSTFLAAAILTAWRCKRAQYQYTLTLLTWKYA